MKTNQTSIPGNNNEGHEETVEQAAERYFGLSAFKSNMRGAFKAGAEWQRNMKIQSTNTHIYEIEELACKITGLDYDEIDADTSIIEQKLEDELGIDLQQLQEIVDRLMPLIMIANSGLTQNMYKGFADIEKGVWFTKMKVL